MLRERLAVIAREEEEALLARLDAEVDEEARLATTRAHFGAREDDRRLGIAALLGRTVHRRRRRYADYLDLWAQLETRDFRQQLESLTQRPATATVSAPAMMADAVVLEVAALP
jgi:hypothetical protein